MTRELMAGGWRRAVFALLVVVPAGGLLVGVLAGLAFAPAGAVSLDAAREALRTETYRATLLYSAALGLGAAVVATPVGLLAAGFLARVRFPGRGAVRTLLLLSLILPPLVTALGLRRVLGDGGAVAVDGRVAAFAAIVLTHALHGVALAVWLCGDAWSRVDPQSVEAARVLGAGRWSAWRGVAWPVLTPSVRAVAALTFGAAFVSVAAVLVAGDGRVTTLESTALRLARDAEPATAAVLALVDVLVLSAAALAAWPRPRGERHQRRPLHGLPLAAGLIATLLALAGIAVVVGGLLDGALRVATGGQPPLEAFVRLAAPAAEGGAREPMLRSLFVAVGATAIAVVLAVSAARSVRSDGGMRRRVARAGLLLPVVLGPVGIALALRDGLELRSGWWLVIAAHALVIYPLALRVAASVPPAPMDALNAARVLGASRLRVWLLLRLRFSVPAVVAATLAALMLSFGEVAATLRIVGSDETVALTLLRAASAPDGDASMAAAAGLLLVVAGVVALVIPARWWLTAAGDE